MVKLTVLRIFRDRKGRTVPDVLDEQFDETPPAPTPGEPPPDEPAPDEPDE